MGDNIMQKQYIAIYNCKKYSINEIMDMIQPYNVRYWHRRQTWETPEEEDVDYKIDILAKFDKAVKIACVEFEDDDDEFGKYIEFDDMKFMLTKNHSWLDCLQSYGWDTFTNIINLEDFQDTEMKVRVNIEKWIDTIAESAAWDVVYNGEARSWY